MFLTDDKLNDKKKKWKNVKNLQKICKMYELDGDFTSGMDHLSVFYEMEDNCDMGFKESSVGNKFHEKKWHFILSLLLKWKLYKNIVKWVF